VAELIGRNRGTIPEWLTKYRSGGREELVLKKVGGGRKRKIPENILLMFQPPYCPESNPIEQIWQYFKKGLRGKLPTSLDELRGLITERLKVMTRQVSA
jgi:transposase